MNAAVLRQGGEIAGEVIGHGPGVGEARIPLGSRVTALPILPFECIKRIAGCSPDAPGGFGELMLAQLVATYGPAVDSRSADAAAFGE